METAGIGNDDAKRQAWGNPVEAELGSMGGRSVRRELGTSCDVSSWLSAALEASTLCVPAVTAELLFYESPSEGWGQHPLRRDGLTYRLPG